MDLSIKLGEKGDKRFSPDHNFHQDHAEVPSELKTNEASLRKLNKLIDTEIDDDKIHSSSLDIRAAHNVLKTTPRASYLLNLSSSYFMEYHWKTTFFIRVLFDVFIFTMEGQKKFY